VIYSLWNFLCGMLSSVTLLSSDIDQHHVPRVCFCFFMCWKSSLRISEAVWPSITGAVPTAFVNQETLPTRSPRWSQSKDYWSLICEGHGNLIVLLVFLVGISSRFAVANVGLGTHSTKRLLTIYIPTHTCLFFTLNLFFFPNLTFSSTSTPPKVSIELELR